MKKINKVSRVSIVLTVKNEDKSINLLLNSLESQKLVPKEIVIVDGGSTDKTIDIIRKKMEKNKKIKLFIEKDSSIARGRNIGISNSTSEIIAMTDAGCIVDSNWLINIVDPIL